MSEEILTDNELKSLKVLAYFYLQIHQYESATRAIKAILAIYPKDAWARAMLVRCEDESGNFNEVLDLTEDMSLYESDKNILQGMNLMRARALQKLGNGKDARAIIDKLGLI